MGARVCARVIPHRRVAVRQLFVSSQSIQLHNASERASDACVFGPKIRLHSLMTQVTGSGPKIKEASACARAHGRVFIARRTLVAQRHAFAPMNLAERRILLLWQNNDVCADYQPAHAHAQNSHLWAPMQSPSTLSMWQLSARANGPLDLKC